MFEYGPAWPHGTFQMAFSAILFIIGTKKTQDAGLEIQTSRTMVALREGSALTY